MNRPCDKCGTENAPDAPACEVCGEPFEFPAGAAWTAVAVALLLCGLFFCLVAR